MLLGIRVGIVLFVLIVSGCSNNNLLMKKQSEMDTRLDLLTQDTVTNGTRLTEMSDELKILRRRDTELSTELALLKTGVQELKSQNEGRARQDEVIAHSPSPARVVVVNKGAAPGDQDAGEQDAYMKAFGLYSTNRFQQAIDAFNLFLAKYPASEYAVNAQYWIGECYYTNRDFARAIEEFTKVSARYPHGKKIPDAMLKVGYSLISIDQRDKARAVLEELVKQYPQSQASAKARERLGRN
jgi:tol-pal system protein YbgF